MNISTNVFNPYGYSSVIMVSSDKKYIKTYDIKVGGENHTVLRDDNLKFLSEVLHIGSDDIYAFSTISQIGINLQKGKIENYFLKSELNNGTEVIIPYKFIPRLDIAMYKAYNDTLLTNDEIVDFDQYEFGILRNLIFAKHNYDFSTEFYQAYFNLYAFYNDPEMRKSRTKDVNGKLTESDKANLKLIKEQEAKEGGK